MPEIESAEKRQGLHLACFTRTVVESKRNSPAPTVKTAFKCESRVSHLLTFLRGEGAIPAEKVAARRFTPVERCTEAYELYLRDVRGLAKATIVNYVPFVCLFLKDHFGDGTVTLSNLCASDVTRFVQRQASHLQRKRAKLLTSALRSFLQYASYRGKTKLDLAAAVPTVANWSMSSIPRAIPADQVRQLLASIDRRTPAGCRDYAILLLLVSFRQACVTRGNHP